MNRNTVCRSAPVAIQLTEDFRPSEGTQIKALQILKTGTFYDPRYKKFAVTEKHFSEMIANFERRVRGVIPSIDYAHETDGPSAGWLKRLFVRDGEKPGQKELWGDFELTPLGQKTLADKTYAYTSADYDESYVCNETGEKYGCVLKGLAFTNRPVIKRMAPAIQLSESAEISEKVEKLVSEGVSPEEALARVLAESSDQPTTQGGTMTEAEIKAMKEENAALKKQLDEGKAATEASAKKLSDAAKTAEEKDAEIERLKGENSKLQKSGEFEKLLSEGKAVEAQREAFLAGDMTKFISLATPIKLSEQGHGKGPANKNDETEVDVEEEIAAKAKKLAEEKKLPLGKAITLVLESDKKLSEKRAAKFSESN